MVEKNVQALPRGIRTVALSPIAWIYTVVGPSSPSAWTALDLQVDHDYRQGSHTDRRALCVFSSLQIQRSLSVDGRQQRLCRKRQRPYPLRDVNLLALDFSFLEGLETTLVLLPDRFPVITGLLVEPTSFIHIIFVSVKT